MITGQGNPVINIGNTSIQLPQTVPDGREEEQVDKTNVYPNPLLNTTLKGRRKYEFKGEYDFGITETNTYSKVQGLLNAYDNRCVFIPYNDLDAINFNSFANVWQYNVEGYLNLKGMRMEVEQIGVSHMKYTQDSVITITKAGVIE